MDEPKKKKSSHSKYIVRNPESLVTHKCVDCGAITPNHRCKKCLRLWRLKHGVYLYDDSNEGE